MSIRYSANDIRRAVDCVNSAATIYPGASTSEQQTLTQRRDAAANALANFIFELDDPNRALFLERVLKG